MITFFAKKSPERVWCMVCDNCGCKDTYVKEHYHDFGDVRFYFNRRFCSKCNSLVYDEELDNEASKKAIHEHNKLVGFDPSKIISLRKKYDDGIETGNKGLAKTNNTFIS